jgi:glutamate receptor, ionotropic, invertebrate
MLLNKRQLEKLKEKWWKKDDVSAKCEKPEDQSDGISIQNIGGVFIVIFVGIGMACITLVFEFWYYKFRKTPKVFGNEEATYNSKFVKNASMKNSSSFGSTGGLIDTNSNSTLKARYPPAGNFRARF